MSKERTPVDAGGIGFLGLLTIVFIVLKLTGYISWSWWWVLAPFWLPLVIGLVIAIVGITLAVLAGFTSGK